MSKKELSLINDSIPKLLVKIATPASIGMFFNTMYNVIDTFYAGKLSTEALAGLSLSFPLFIIILALGLGIATAATTLISNALGGGKESASSVDHAQAVGLGVLVSLGASAVLFVFLPDLFRFMGAENEIVLGYAVRYTQVIVAGSIFFVMNFILNAGLNARGMTKYFRNAIIFGCLANVGLDPLFMFGLHIGGVTIIPAMGVVGIAVATVVIQMGTMLYLAKKVQTISCFGGCGLSAYVPKWKYTRQIVRLAVPSSIDFMTMSLGVFVILRFLAPFGTEQVAAFGVALRIEQIALLPSIGLNTALAALVGQNNGAGRIDRVKKSYATSLFFCLLLMLVVLTLVLVFNRALLRLFTEDALVVQYARVYLFTQAVAHYSYILMSQSNSVLQGIKQPGWILIAGPLRQIAFPLLVFPLFIHLFGGVIGIWWGIVLVNWLLAITTFIIARAKIDKERLRMSTA